MHGSAENARQLKRVDMTRVVLKLLLQIIHLSVYVHPIFSEQTPLHAIISSKRMIFVLKVKQELFCHSNFAIDRFFWGFD